MTPKQNKYLREKCKLLHDFGIADSTKYLQTQSSHIQDWALWKAKVDALCYQLIHKQLE